MSKQCYTCAYRENIPGDCHSRCSFDFQKANIKKPAGNPTGVKNGWYMFPANYDPTWMVEDCQAFSETANPEFKREGNMFEDLISLLAKRL